MSMLDLDHFDLYLLCLGVVLTALGLVLTFGVAIGMLVSGIAIMAAAIAI